MGDGSNLDGKVGLDIGDYKAKVNELNTQIRVIETGFRASAAALGDWSKDADGMQLRTQALTKVIDLQRQKVENLTKVYGDIVEKEGEGSKAAQEYQIKINKATEELNKHEKELSDTNQALDDIKNETSQASKGVEDLGDKAEKSGLRLDNLKKIVGGVVTTLKVLAIGATAVAGAVAGIGAGAAKMALDTAKQSEALVDLSNKTGISVTRLQEMAYAGEIVGTDLETMTGVLGRLTRSMGEARDQQSAFNEQLNDGKLEDEISGNYDLIAAFDQLGVTITNTDGTLRNREEVFNEAITALGNMTDETERDVIAQKLLGKSAMELNPLIKAGSEELGRLAEEAHKVGAVMSEEDVAAGAAFQDQMDSLQMGLKGVVNTIGAAFMPAFSGIATTAGGYLKELAGIVKGSNGDMGQMADGISGLFGRIVTDLAKQGPKMAKGGLAILSGLVKAIISNLPIILPAVTAIVGSLVGFIGSNLPLLGPAAVTILLMLVDLLVQNLPMLIDVALQIVIALANGLAQAAPTMIPQITELIIQIVNILVSNAPLLATAAIALLLALVQGLIAALPILVEAMPQIIGAIVNAIIAILPQVTAMGFQIIQMLINGITQSGPGILSALGRALAAALLGAGLIVAKFLTIGKGIVDSVWKGIQANASKFYNDVKNFFAGLVKKAKDAIGMKSPIPGFVDIGEGIMDSTALGITRRFGNLSNILRNAMGGLLNFSFDGMSVGGGFGMQSVSNSESFANYGTLIIQESAGSLVQSVKAKAKRF